MLGLKLNHVSKRGHYGKSTLVQGQCYQETSHCLSQCWLCHHMVSLGHNMVKLYYFPFLGRHQNLFWGTLFGRAYYSVIWSVRFLIILIFNDIRWYFESGELWVVFYEFVGRSIFCNNFLCCIWYHGLLGHARLQTNCTCNQMKKILN